MAENLLHRGGCNKSSGIPQVAQLSEEYPIHPIRPFLTIMITTLIATLLLTLLFIAPATSAEVDVEIQWGENFTDGNISIEMPEYGYGGGGTGGWTELVIYHNNNSVYDGILEAPEEIPSYLHTTGDYEKSFSLPPINISTNLLDLTIEDLNMTFRGNPPLPELTFTLSYNESSAKELEGEVWVNRTSVDATFTNERFPVEIKVENTHMFPVVLNISDQLPDGLVVDPYNNLQWELSVPPMSERSIKYTAQALKPGNYTIERPNVKCEYPIMYSSNNTSFPVFGPYVQINKQAQMENGKIDVVVYLNNTGTEKVNVYLVDFIPEYCILRSGVLNKTLVLDVEENYTNHYTLSVSDGGDDIKLPRAQVLFVSGRQVDTSYVEDAQIPDYLLDKLNSKYAYGFVESAIVEVRPISYSSNIQSYEQPYTHDNVENTGETTEKVVSSVNENADEGIVDKLTSIPSKLPGFGVTTAILSLLFAYLFINIRQRL
ncbi:MAG: hypothetical protein ACXQS2_05460 [Methermicoccaceae archaeon]